MTIQEIPLNIPDNQVIEYLENLLEEAKKGNIQSIAIVFSKGNLLTGNLWAGMGKNNMAIIGELSCLQQELLDWFAERRKQPVFYE